MPAMVLRGSLVVLAGASIAMVGAWLYQRRRGEADVVDVVWTAGLGAGALVWAALLEPFPAARRWLVALIAIAWSLRLSLHLLERVRAPGEDGRYAELRERWGASASGKLLALFLAQAATVALLSIHFALAMMVESGLRWLDLAGVAIAVAAILGETVADRQLAAFRRDPSNAGDVCRIGLWGRSRHPNYFFEWLHWWAYVPIAWGSPWWPWTLAAPLAMYVLLRHVTGIPPAEEQSLRSRGEGYRRYQEDVPAFFPRLAGRA
jgi:steroid 5-alpha reductase family enzyme